MTTLRSTHRVPAILLGLLIHSVAMASEVVIVHFGDSTCITSYLPAGQRVEAKLNARLANAYPGQSITNLNVAQDGDFIRRFLDDGRYLREVRDRFNQIDIALIRYGQNDMKRFSPEEFQRHLGELCDRVEKDYPSVKIILETNTYLKGGRNEDYNRYWDVTRAVAASRHLPLVDIYQRRQREVEAGNWDLAIRNQKLSREKYDRVIADDSKDEEMTGHADWFGDTHPNIKAVDIAVDEEFNVFRRLWPDRLPGREAHP